MPDDAAEDTAELLATEDDAMDEAADDAPEADADAEDTVPPPSASAAVRNALHD